MTQEYELQISKQPTQANDQNYVRLTAAEIVDSLTYDQISDLITEVFKLTQEKIRDEEE